MVCAGDAGGPSSSSLSNSDLEIGCLIDLATGLVSFTANGKELSTTYQVKEQNSKAEDGLPHNIQYVHVIIFLSCGIWMVFLVTTA